MPTDPSLPGRVALTSDFGYGWRWGAGMRRIAGRVGWGVLALLAVAIGAVALRYITFDTEMAPPELRQNLIDHPAFFTAHAIFGGLALLIGVWQFLPVTRRSRYHPWAGRFYVAFVAVASVCGFIVALSTEAGAVASAGFIILAILWFSTTALAYWHIRRRNYAAHQRWMVRSYAVTCAAITLRLIIPIGGAFGATFLEAYVVAAWASWIVNLAIAELLIRRDWIPPLPARVASAARR